MADPSPIRVARALLEYAYPEDIRALAAATDPWWRQLGG